MKQANSHFGKGHGDSFHGRQAMSQLGGFRFQKFTAGRDLVKQLAHVDGGAITACRWRDFIVGRVYLPGVIVGLRA